MAKKQIRSATVTIFLLKEHIKTPAQALEPDTPVRKVDLSPDSRIDGSLYIKNEPPKSPGWVQFVDPIIEEDINLRTQSSAAVLFVHIAKRRFAVTFGYGRTLLAPSSYERDFGMKVAVNRVNPDSLRSIDIKNYDELVVSTRKQTSRSTVLSTFGLDVARDLLKAVVGESADPALARRIAGADSVTLVGAMTAADIPAKCRACLTAYRDKQYKRTAFGWIDQLEEVRDPALVAALEQNVLAAIKAGGAGLIYLAPAEIEDWDDIEKFGYGGVRSTAEFDDLDFDDYLGVLGAGLLQLTVDKLKAHTVSIKRAGSGNLEPRWSVFRCLIWEGEFQRQRYALYDERWFKIDADFYRELTRDIARIPPPAIILPPSTAVESEEDYNARAAAADRKLALLDQKCVSVPGASSPIEICDLLSEAGQFIHIKRKTRSATLSHLFAQGTTAGELFLRSLDFRVAARAKLRGKAKFIAMMSDRRPNAGKFEVAYVVIAKAGPRRTLPFFSRVNLRQAHQRLSTLGYKVSFGFVDC